MQRHINKLETMLRVDHAGEYGAVRIYEGQRAVFAALPGKEKTCALIEEMAEQEQAHLDTFDKLLNQHQIRPTLLGPLWHAAGFSLGVVTALMGEKAAMACTAAVEEVIDDHYASQIETLRQDAARGENTELLETIESFRADEAAHRDTALNHGAEDAPGYQLMRSVIRFGCQTAIRISERI